MHETGFMCRTNITFRYKILCLPDTILVHLLECPVEQDNVKQQSDNGDDGFTFRFHNQKVANRFGCDMGIHPKPVPVLPNKF